ncbi:MAG: hypothetical protein JXA68_08120 [Ignavibacteriales bacterium]|nr:hypothetical protein [Ignavibacteriales bacterium]
MKPNKVFIILFFVVILNYGQPTTIIQIFDSNLFLLDNGDTVKMAGIDIPITNHYNKELSYIANEVINYCESNLLNKPLTIEYVRNNVTNEGYKLVHIKREYPLESKDFNKLFLECGYGKFNGKINAQYYFEYKNAEYDAFNRAESFNEKFNYGFAFDNENIFFSMSYSF